jgi:peptidyl-prolyl cis-trans isomerase C
MSEVIAESPGAFARPVARPTPTTLLQRALRDPFIHFLILGALILWSARWFHSSRDPEKIVVDPARIGQTYVQQYGHEPSTADLRALVDRYIQDEIYYREGVSLGFQEEDEIVRRRVVQKYEFLQQDTVVADEPDTAALQSYFRDHVAKYATSERVSFTHVYFEADGRNDQSVLARAESVKAHLQATGSARAPQAGDAFAELYDYASLGHDELNHLFGAQPVVDALLQAPLNVWSGPYRSGYGWHLVRVTQQEPARTPPFEEVRERVRNDYLAERRRQRTAEQLANLRQRYVVQIAGQP